MHGHLELSFSLRSFIGRYPSLFFPIYGMNSKNRRLSVGQDTQLVIEGFPRSANTFAVVAFHTSQPTRLKLAHHMHVPAQIIKAARIGVPSVVLIRNPKDAVVSFVIRDRRMDLERALKGYISFYERIIPFQDNFILAPFEVVINDYSKVIEDVNKKFGTDFIASTPKEKDLEAIFSKIDSFEKGDESRSSRPSSIRKKIKKNLAQKLNTKKYKTLLLRSEELYNQLLGH